MTFTSSFRMWRRNLKAHMPYVRRREFKILQRRHNELIDAMGSAVPATEARLDVLKPISERLTAEVCLFVSHASSPLLKPHVKCHIEHLLAEGLKVVLILNTDLAPSSIIIESELLSQLSGAFIRENIGFDFAAWAHVYSRCEGVTEWTRLFLVNDSIVGPLSSSNFESVLERVRRSSADVVGLTESIHPLPHIQSFFLVFNTAAIRSPVLQLFFRRVLNLPTKDQVIDVYETRLTQVLRRSGLRCQAIFPPLSNDPHSANDTYFQWDDLIRNGFPYIKASVLFEQGATAKVKALVPNQFLHPQS